MRKKQKIICGILALLTTLGVVWLLNTLLVSTSLCVLTTSFILIIGYVLSRLRFRMRKPLIDLLLVAGMFPGFMSMIAVYSILKAMGLTNSLVVLVVAVIIVTLFMSMQKYYVEGVTNGSVKG